MPGSWPYLRSDITKYLTSNFPSTSKILDIGAGEGTYYDLLKHHFNDFDGIEIFEPYIEKYDLKNKYNNLYLGNIVDFEFPDFDYDIIIMGDTLEHLSETDARTVINKYINRVNEFIAIVPLNLPQDEVFGNIYEKHLQPTLSFESMKTLYPELKVLNIDDKDVSVKIDVGDNVYYQVAYVKV